jgi:hypothetical protein
MSYGSCVSDLSSHACKWCVLAVSSSSMARCSWHIGVKSGVWRISLWLSAFLVTFMRHFISDGRHSAKKRDWWVARMLPVVCMITHDAVSARADDEYASDLYRFML